MADRICPNCGHDTVTGRPATKLRPEEPAAEEEPKPKTSASSAATMLLLAAIVLTYGFAGWRWFTAPASVAPVYNAAKGVERNLTLRQTMARLSASVQLLTTEVAAARDNDPTSTEAEALDNYAAAVDVVNDSLTVWAAKMEHGPTLPGDIDDLAPLKAKYALPADDDGNILADPSLEAIWKKARESLDAGDKFYAQ